MTERYPFSPLEFERLDSTEGAARLAAFADRMGKRRTVREYSGDPVPRELVEDCIRVAGMAPSGANQQPWKFVLVADPEVKRKIREAAEEEEYENYHGRMPADWLEKLAPLGTDEHKPFLEIAPYLIVVFKEDYGVETDADGSEKKIKHYYVNESVGLASGFLLAALHLAGLATLTHTPSPMGFLTEVLGMPRRMKPFLLVPVGYPAPDARVPDIGKKSLDEIRILR
jgi:iodotyrosine deiodinase